MLDLPKCRYCGCDELHACPGGCSWWKPGYCSACAEKHFEELVNIAVAQSERVGPGQGGPVVARLPLGKQECTLVIESDNVRVTDHIGVRIFNIDADGAYLAPHYDAPELLPLFDTEAREAA